jgi:phosphoglycolate phosphatase/pyrophosphatase PpaX
MTTPARLEWMIFDVDGTLADTLPFCIAAYRHAFALHGHPDLDDVGVTALFGPSDEGIIRNVVGDAWQACYEDFYAYYTSEHDARVTPLPGVRELLAELARRAVRLTVLTGKGEPTARYSLKRLGLLEFFDDVVCGSPAGRVKGERLAEMARTAEIPGAQIGYIADEPPDMIAARKAEVVPVGAAWAAGSSAAALRAAGAAIVALQPDDLLRLRPPGRSVDRDPRIPPGGNAKE